MRRRRPPWLFLLGLFWFLRRFMGRGGGRFGYGRGGYGGWGWGPGGFGGWGRGGYGGYGRRGGYF